MMANQPVQSFTFTDSERSYAIQALRLLCDSIRRARNKQVSGSALFNAMSENLREVEAVCSKLGG